ncbi:RHS repeat-associated core domain-containing protein [Dactylosporangium darangshiense]|uniref:RHS repeat-associated core domain-containing protein n=1 Tax=Dactylosporangium darangshiense TaxID=579108 RepID=UPI00362AA49E
MDETTGRLTSSKVETENQSTPNLWVERLTQNYGYDRAGNVKNITETSAGATVSNECFTYDQLRELTEAWTTTAATCQDPPTIADVGGPDAYWTTYGYQTGTSTYNNGNRKTEVRHAIGGGSDTTRTYNYTDPTKHHTLSNVATTGATTSTDSYTYDNAGNTLTRTIAGTGQALDWDSEGHLTTVTDTTGVTSYIYDANGNRLIAKDPTGVTAYLPGFEVRKAGTTTTCTRYLGPATRTPTGTTWITSDAHGTGQLAIDAATLAVTRRKTDPFGNPLGTDPTWPNPHGFVGGIRDNTGLTHLGAREYEPITGRFISDDPVTDVADPQQLNGYAYANNTPVSSSDPTGLRTDDQYYQPGGMNDSVPTPPAVKPKAGDERLRNIIDDLYRDGASRGDGTTAGALEEEMRTGEPTMSRNNETGEMEGTWHYDKAANKANALAGLLRENEIAKAEGRPPTLSADDERIAKAELKRLWKSLNTEMPDEMKRYYLEPARAEALKNQLKALRTNKYIASVTGAEVETRLSRNGRTTVFTMKTLPAVEGAARFFLLVDVAAFTMVATTDGWDAAVSSFIYMWIGDPWGGAPTCCAPKAQRNRTANFDRASLKERGTRVDRIEASLAAVDWSSIIGERWDGEEEPLADMPRMVRDLWHADLSRRWHAADYVAAAGFEYASLRDATVPLIPVFVAVLTDPRSEAPTLHDIWDPELPLRARLLNLLATAADAAAWGGVDEELRAKAAVVAADADAGMSLADRVAGAEAPLRLGVRALAGRVLGDLLPFLDDPDPRIAHAAVFAVSQFARLGPDARGAAVRALLAVAQRTDGVVSVAGEAAYGLAVLGADTTSLLSHPALVVRACAALSPATAGDARSVAALEEALRYTPANDRWRPPGSSAPGRKRLHIEVAGAAAQRAASFDDLVPGAFVVATPEAESTEAGWGPLLRVAFPPGWPQRPLTGNQREFLRRLVDNDDIWGERAESAMPYFAAVGLPEDREACRAIATGTGTS